MEATMTLPANPKGKIKTGTIVGIGAGVVLLAGGIWAGVYFYNKSKEEGRVGDGDGSGGAGTGTGTGTGAGAGTGAGTGSYNPCASRAGSNECIEWQKKQAQLATSGRGFDGRRAYMLLYA